MSNIEAASNTFGANSAQLDAAYGGQLAADAVAAAKKRDAVDAGLDASKAPAKTVRVVLEGDDETPRPQQQTKAPVATPSAVQAPPPAQKLSTAAKQKPPSTFDFRNLMTAEIISQVVKVADTFAKSGDYVNLNPKNKEYSQLFGQQVDCGFHFQVQTPPLVCTTGIKNSEKFPGAWSALLANGEVEQLIDQLNTKAQEEANATGQPFVARKPENGDFFTFLNALAEFLTDQLVTNGEKMFLEASQRVSARIEEAKKKNPNAKVEDPYRSSAFVTRGKSDPVYKNAYETGAYTVDDYRKEVSQYIQSFLTEYDGKQSFQTRFYCRKDINGNKLDHIPDVIIVNGATGMVEDFNPNAPYCQKGRTAWEMIVKFSMKWEKNQFRMYAHGRLMVYHVLGGGGGGITFSDAAGNVHTLS